MSESIADIVREMREFADTESQSIGRDVLRREIQHFADRIEAAYKRETVTDCNALQDTCKQSLQGNAAKMREALELCVKMLDICLLYSCDGYPSQSEDIQRAIAKGESALSAPPRNCDIYRTKKERDAAYKKYREYVIMSNANPFIAQDEMMPKENWLFAKAKGGME